MNFSVKISRSFFFVPVILASLLVGCSMPSLPWQESKMPSIYHVPLWQWHNNITAAPERLNIPTTGKNQGPTHSVLVRHDVGLGPSLTGVNVKSQFTASGKQFLASESAQLIRAGWKALFTPAEGGAYPDFVLYQTFTSGSHYCLLEYTATVVNEKQTSQQVDVYYG